MIARRGLLKLGLGAAVGAASFSASSMAWALPGDAPRRLAFHHTHTGETLAVTYFDDGGYVPGALKEVNHLLRDYHNDQVHRIDPDLLDTLTAIRRRTGASTPFEIVCGYRSPATNKRMAARSGEVARHSLHLTGQAIDIRQGGVDIDRLFAAARGLQDGGVGYYPQSRFVHVDVGPVRAWSGT
jgi:uncharacterized protein YcbK (DUF882 family)